MSALDGKVALVTGAAAKRSMGRAIAVQLAADGANVVVADKVAAPQSIWPGDEGWTGLDAVVAEVAGLGRRGLAITADVSSAADVEAMVAPDGGGVRQDRHPGPLRGRPGAGAGPGGRSGRGHVAHASGRQPHRALFWWRRRRRKAMLADPAGTAGKKIILVSSMAGVSPYPGGAGYCASKHGVLGLMKTLARELAPHKINVNAINPGAFETNFRDDSLLKQAQDRGMSVEESLKNPPTGPYRPGRPAAHPAGPPGHPAGHRRSRLVPGLGAGKLHHRRRHQPERRRQLSGPPRTGAADRDPADPSHTRREPLCPKRPTRCGSSASTCSTGKVSEELIDGETTEKYVGGTGLGTKYLWDEVPAGVDWSDPENRITFFTGPLAGTRVSGSGTFSVTTKGACTDMCGTSQANGFLGAFMRFNGVDGVDRAGRGRDVDPPAHPRRHGASCIDAEHLLGLDTWETEDAVKEEIGQDAASSASGRRARTWSASRPSSATAGTWPPTTGWARSWAPRRLKCISATKGDVKPRVVDTERLRARRPSSWPRCPRKSTRVGQAVGTNAGIAPLSAMGAVPIRNYTTNVFPENNTFVPEYLRSHFKAKPVACWACSHRPLPHDGSDRGPVRRLLRGGARVRGQRGDGSADRHERTGVHRDALQPGGPAGVRRQRIGLHDLLAHGVLREGPASRSADLDGVEMHWGDAEAVAAMLKKIAHREGCGDFFADGVKRCAEKVGGEAQDCAVYTLKGATPRGHDHRGHWLEFIDTCLSNTGTVETARPSLHARPIWGWSGCRTASTPLPCRP